MNPVCILKKALSFRSNGKNYKKWERNFLWKTNHKRSWKILQKFPLGKLKENEILLRKEDFTGKEFYEALMSIVQEKSPENDGLTKEF